MGKKGRKTTWRKSLSPWMLLRDKPRRDKAANLVDMFVQHMELLQRIAGENYPLLSSMKERKKEMQVLFGSSPWSEFTSLGHILLPPPPQFCTASSSPLVPTLGTLWFFQVWKWKVTLNQLSGTEMQGSHGPNLGHMANPGFVSFEPVTNEYIGWNSTVNVEWGFSKEGHGIRAT